MMGWLSEDRAVRRSVMRPFGVDCHRKRPQRAAAALRVSTT